MDLTPYKELLLKLKSEATIKKDDIKITFQAERAADELDVATHDINASLNKRLLERQQAFVRRINIALEKIEDGTYGLCEECGEEINPRRLLARPVAVLCIDCKEKQERKESMDDKNLRGINSEEVLF